MRKLVILLSVLALAALAAASSVSTRTVGTDGCKITGITRVNLRLTAQGGCGPQEAIWAWKARCVNGKYRWPVDYEPLLPDRDTWVRGKGKSFKVYSLGRFTYCEYQFSLRYDEPGLISTFAVRTEVKNFTTGPTKHRGP